MFADPFGGTEADWAWMLDLNLLAAVRTTRAALPALLAGGGAVVNISSDTGRKPSSTPLSYAVAKSALNAFSHGLAETVGPQGVRVNTVSPSATSTPLLTGQDGIVRQIAAAMGADHEAVLAGFPQRGGLLTGQLIEPGEIARAVVLLTSPAMPSAIGQNWGVDAGSVKAV